MSVFKAGSTVPVKFQLKDASGNPVEVAVAPVWLSPQKGGALSAAVDESIYSYPASSGTAFKYDAGSQQYVYNWSTKGLASGYWYKISVKLDDGTIRSVVLGIK